MDPLKLAQKNLNGLTGHHSSAVFSTSACMRAQHPSEVLDPTWLEVCLRACVFACLLPRARVLFVHACMHACVRALALTRMRPCVCACMSPRACASIVSVDVRACIRTRALPRQHALADVALDSFVQIANALLHFECKRLSAATTATSTA